MTRGRRRNLAANGVLAVAGAAAGSHNFTNSLIKMGNAHRMETRWVVTIELFGGWGGEGLWFNHHERGWNRAVLLGNFIASGGDY